MKMRPTGVLSLLSLLSCAAVFAAAGVAGADPPQITARKPLIELKASAPTFDPRNGKLSLTLVGALTDVHGRPCDIDVSAGLADGALTGVRGGSGLWRSLRVSTDAAGLTFDGAKLAGVLKFKAAASRRGGKPFELSLSLAAAAAPMDDTDTPAQRVLAGTWAAGPGGAGGKLTGVLSPVRKAGFFDRGHFDGGLKLRLDLGSQRVGWNHQRCATYLFPEPVDITKYTGLRVTVRTEKPRHDAMVTVWVRETDGSWYYVKGAVPLTDAENQATLRWTDLRVSEWVAPGSHLDEDNLFDCKAFDAFAVGVINPLGIGKVAFTLTGAELVREDLPPPAPVACAVTGKTLSVNGHNMVPAGIFGGFAYDLPQEYRPGCQRGLYAHSRPRIIRQMAARFGGESAPDWPKALDAFQGRGPRAALGKYLRGLVDDERVQQDLDATRVPDDMTQEKARVLPRGLAGLLDRLLELPIYAPAAWAGVALPDGLAAEVKRFQAGKCNHTERMEMNRRLLQAALPQLPPYRPRTEAFFVDCLGERKETAIFFRSDWQEQLRDFGRTYASHAKQAGVPVVFEFWNEPYLNWAEKSWIHYHPGHYRTDLREDGGPVAVRRSSQITERQVLDWKRLAGIFRAGKDAKEGDFAKRFHDALARDRRTAEQFDALKEGHAPGGDLARVLVRLVNEVVMPRGPRGRDEGNNRGRDFYKPEHFEGVALPKDIEALLPVLKEEAPDGRRTAILNRGLLSAKYPGMLGPDPAAGPPEIIPHFRWKKIPTGWRVVDDTAISYWSAKGNGFIYDSMMQVIGKAMKETFSGMKVFAGWGFRWNENHWGAWDLLYRDTIDRNIGWIDGIHEHHYQGEPIAMQGTYEVACAYGVTKYGKWLYSMNTETNDLLDSPARGRVDSDEKRRLSCDYRVMVYNMRDCLYSVLQCPDKAFGRTMIHYQRYPRATPVTWGMMKDLRGRLVATDSADRDVWCVASVDGTDPQAMPPQPGGQTLVVFVLNDHIHPRKVSLDVHAPDGTRFTGGSIERNTVDWNSFDLALQATDAEVAAGATKLHFDFELPGKLAWKVSLPLDKPITDKDQVRRRQFFSPDLLKQVRRDQPLATGVSLDPDVLKAAKRAWLRLVIEDVARGEAVVSVNGEAAKPVPPAYTADNVTQIVRVPLDVASLAPANSVRFTVAPGNHAGYRVDMTSIVLELRD